MSGSPHASARLSLQELLSLLGPFTAPAEAASLQDWYTAWQRSLPTDADARLRLLAAHDLRMCLHAALDLPLTALPADARMAELLPAQGRRAFWEGLADACEWTLPRMGLPAWAQTLFGVVLLAGLVLPFWWPVLALLLPVALALSFLLENRVAHLPYPSLDAVAARMVTLNAPAIHLGKFAEEDLERVFYELACLATGQELPLSGWEQVPMPGR
jgi:hypothetical protein